MALRLWTVDPKHLERIEELMNLYQKGLLGEHDYIEKLRGLGFPMDTTPGDEVRVRVASRSFHVGTSAKEESA